MNRSTCTPSEFCHGHSGLIKAIETVEETDKAQWLEINSIKGWIIGGMGASILQLVAVILFLVFGK